MTSPPPAPAHTSAAPSSSPPAAPCCASTQPLSGPRLRDALRSQLSNQSPVLQSDHPPSVECSLSAQQDCSVFNRHRQLHWRGSIARSMRGAPTVPVGVLDRSFRSTRPEREGRLLRYRAHSRHCNRRRADERHTHRERNNPGCRTLRPAIAETPSSFPVQNSRHSSRANGALTKEHVEHCLDVALIAAVGPAGVGIVVESSTGCGQSLSILLRHLGMASRQPSGERDATAGAQTGARCSQC